MDGLVNSYWRLNVSEVLTVQKLVVTQDKSPGDVDKMVRRGELIYIGNGRYQKTVPVATIGPKPLVSGRWQSEFPNPIAVPQGWDHL